MGLEIQVTFDVADLDRMAAFWALALGYEPEPPPEGFASWEEFAERNHIPRELWRAAVVDPERQGPRLFFQPVPEGKTAKNRVHLDIRSSALAAEGEDPRDHARAHAATLVEAGATILHEKDEPIGWSIVMQDPEGNEFCVT
jgi:catechol 2,3-dioxygenase-like lactoylglutathione lyase family enzyme